MTDVDLTRLRDVVHQSTNHTTDDVDVALPGTKLWTYDDFANLEPPAWRIDSVLPDNALSLIFGKQSTYKSFVALAWCLHIASGSPWLGHPVIQGHVIYIAAEGGFGLFKRIRAWEADNPTADFKPRFRAIPHRVDLRSPADLGDLTLALREQLDDQPALIVVDTWSRNTPGANENSAEDTSAAVARLDEIRETFNTGVVVVHHSGHENNRERGSSALAAAADCRWETDGKPNQSTILLRNHKQKDWADTDPIPLRADLVGTGDDASLVIRHNITDPCDRHKLVVDALDGADAVTQVKLESRVPGRGVNVRDLAHETADCPHCPVRTWRGARNAVMYGRSDQGAVPW